MNKMGRGEEKKDHQLIINVKIPSGNGIKSLYNHISLLIFAPRMDPFPAPNNSKAHLCSHTASSALPLTGQSGWYLLIWKSSSTISAIASEI